MKRFFVVALLLATCQVFAQNIKNSLAISLDAKDKSITLYTYDASLEIEGYDGNEIVIERLKQDDQNNPASIDGLQRLTNREKVPDNGGINYRITRDTSSTLELNVRSAGKFKIFIPNKLVLFSLNGYENDEANKIHISHLKCRFKVFTTVGELVVDHVSKGFNLDGKSKIKVRDVDWDINDHSNWAYRIVSNNNDVDIAMPETLAADIYVSTGQGNFYSDIDLKTGGATLKKNGGGVKIQIVTNNTNVYLRKQK